MDGVTETPRFHPKGTLCPYLDAGVTTQVEVELRGVRDLGVHGCARRNVSALPHLHETKAHETHAGDNRVRPPSMTLTPPDTHRLPYWEASELASAGLHTAVLQ